MFLCLFSVLGRLLMDVVNIEFMNLFFYFSGIFGIFWYQEITEPKVIRKWFLSALACVSGIIWLSRERILARTAEANQDEN